MDDARYPSRATMNHTAKHAGDKNFQNELALARGTVDNIIRNAADRGEFSTIFSFRRDVIKIIAPELVAAGYCAQIWQDGSLFVTWRD